RNRWPPPAPRSRERGRPSPARRRCCRAGTQASRRAAAPAMPAFLHDSIDVVRATVRSEEHTSELQSRFELVCRLLLEKKNEQQVSRARYAGDVLFRAAHTPTS